MSRIVYFAVVAGALLAIGGVASPVFATNSDHKIGICHATGSTKNPYVFIIVDEHAAKAHTNHQDGRDVVGVNSSAACPKTASVGEVLGTSTTAPATPAVMPTMLPETGGMEMSAILGLPALVFAGISYIRSRVVQ